MTNSRGFRPFVPTLAYPRVAAMQGRDAHAHGAAGLANPMPRDLLFTPWEALYHAPFTGITTDGVAQPGLFTLEPAGASDGASDGTPNAACNGAPTQAMVAATLHLIERVSADQRSALMFPLDAREWRRWNNTEMYVYKYGLRLEEVSVPVREAMLAVVRASLSAKGYQKTRDVMRLNHFMGELAGNTRVLGEWSFNFTLFGAPSIAQPWGWQLCGHHLALNCLVIGGQMVLTPAFMGAEPNYADTGPWAGTRLFEDEENGGLALVRALSDAQRERAIIYHSGTGADLPPGRRHRADQLHLGGAFQDNRIIPYEGAEVAGFSKAQRRQLLDLVQAYIEPLPDGAREQQQGRQEQQDAARKGAHGGPRRARIEEIERHLDATHFCWIGGTGEDDTFYYRIHSPVVMIEFDHHSGVFLTNTEPAKFHIHTIVRTPNGNDYGADLLSQHYARDHHAGSGRGQSAAQIGHVGAGHEAAPPVVVDDGRDAAAPDQARRYRAAQAWPQPHGIAPRHDHAHPHPHPHPHTHTHNQAQGHDHPHSGSHSHSHGDTRHSHPHHTSSESTGSGGGARPD